MKLLLDTNSFIYFINGDKGIPEQTVNYIKDINNEIFLSIASLWEISIKISLGKLKLKEDFSLISEFLEVNEISILPIVLKHLKTLMKLEYFHRDPLDRIIIAQRISENIPIATNDKVFNRYSVELIWN